MALAFSTVPALPHLILAQNHDSSHGVFGGKNLIIKTNPDSLVEHRRGQSCAVNRKDQRTDWVAMAFGCFKVSATVKTPDIDMVV